MNCKKVDAQQYIELVKKGPNMNLIPGSKDEVFYDKIRKDTNRTFKGDYNFSNRVPEEKLIRVLNALTHYFDEGI